MKSTLCHALTGMLLFGLLAACEREVILQGERFPLRAPLADSLPLEGQPDPVAPSGRPENTAQPIALPLAQANADWPQRGGNARHASPHGMLSAQPALVWSAAIGEGNSRRNRIAAAPVVAEGRVFSMDAKSRLAATSTRGTALWAVDLSADFDRDGALSGGGLAAGAGRIYAATGFGELVALDAALGTVVWRQRLDSPVAGAPAVDGNTVYVVGRDGSGWALDAGNGRVLWQVPGTPATAGMTGGSAPAVGDTTVIFPFASGQLLAVLKDGGTPVWAAQVTGERLGRGYSIVGDVTGDPVIAGTVTYAGTAAGRTAAMDTATGARLWTAVEGALNPPLVVGGSVFVVNDEGRLVRMDAATGAVIWAVDMPYFTTGVDRKRKAITAHYGPVLAGGRIVVASSDGALRLFSPTDGAMVGSAAIPGGAASSPALAGGMLFVVAMNGQLHAFR